MFVSSRDLFFDVITGGASGRCFGSCFSSLTDWPVVVACAIVSVSRAGITSLGSENTARYVFRVSEHVIHK